MAVAETLANWLSTHGVRYDLVAHPRTASTHQSDQAAHVPEDHIAKAVIVKDEEGYAMVVVPGDQWVRLDALNRETGRMFLLALEKDVQRLFPDCLTGAIPPAGPAYGLETLMDEALTSLASVYLEAGDHERLVKVTGRDFLSLLEGSRNGHFSH